ncbi:hypothetical protein ZPAH1_orf00036 [Aeromonas phage ZPAH1]|nr:hypothetical protein ZPAH1_orf00036 [Aeromonas phage ZPAH1]
MSEEMKHQSPDVILVALDRVHSIRVMMESLLGSVDREDISDVHVAVKPHASLLLRAQDSLLELYQSLGNDLHQSEVGRDSPMKVQFHGVVVDVPTKYKSGWLAMNPGGMVFAFVNRPHSSYGCWVDDKKGFGTATIRNVTIDKQWFDTRVKIEDYIINEN